MGFDLRTANGNGKVLNLASNYASLFTYLAVSYTHLDVYKRQEHILSEQTLEKIRERAIETDAELGKTVQVLSYLLAMKESGQRLPSLIVCPASLVLN